MDVELAQGGEVDRGTPVTITVFFDRDPVEVYATFIRPGEKRAVVDPGYGKSGSRIRRPAKGAYSYVIDTTGFRPGRVDWHVWGVEDASKFGWFVVRASGPPQLL